MSQTRNANEITPVINYLLTAQNKGLAFAGKTSCLSQLSRLLSILQDPQQATDAAEFQKFLTVLFRSPTKYHFGEQLVAEAEDAKIIQLWLLVIEQLIKSNHHPKQVAKLIFNGNDSYQLYHARSRHILSDITYKLYENIQIQLLLQRLLLNEAGDDLTAAIEINDKNFREAKVDLKRQIFALITAETLDRRQRIEYLIQALNRNTGLGKLFYHPRGYTACHYNSGILSEIHQTFTQLVTEEKDNNKKLLTNADSEIEVNSTLNLIKKNISLLIKNHNYANDLADQIKHLIKLFDQGNSPATLNKVLKPLFSNSNLTVTLVIQNQYETLSYLLALLQKLLDAQVEPGIIYQYLGQKVFLAQHLMDKLKLLPQSLKDHYQQLLLSCMFYNMLQKNISIVEIDNFFKLNENSDITKDLMLSIILEHFNAEQRIVVLNEALDNTTLFGYFFHYQRGVTACNEDHGHLQKIRLILDIKQTNILNKYYEKNFDTLAAGFKRICSHDIKYYATSYISPNTVDYDDALQASNQYIEWINSLVNLVKTSQLTAKNSLKYLLCSKKFNSSTQLNQLFESSNFQMDSYRYQSLRNLDSMLRSHTKINLLSKVRAGLGILLLQALIDDNLTNNEIHQLAKLDLFGLNSREVVYQTIISTANVKNPHNYLQISLNTSSRLYNFFNSARDKSHLANLTLLNEHIQAQEKLITAVERTPIETNLIIDKKVPTVDSATQALDNAQLFNKPSNFIDTLPSNTANFSPPAYYAPTSNEEHQALQACINDAPLSYEEHLKRSYNAPLSAQPAPPSYEVHQALYGSFSATCNEHQATTPSSLDPANATNPEFAENEAEPAVNEGEPTTETSNPYEAEPAVNGEPTAPEQELLIDLTTMTQPSTSDEAESAVNGEPTAPEQELLIDLTTMTQPSTSDEAEPTIYKGEPTTPEQELLIDFTAMTEPPISIAQSLSQIFTQQADIENSDITNISNTSDAATQINLAVTNETELANILGISLDIAAQPTKAATQFFQPAERQMTDAEFQALVQLAPNIKNSTEEKTDSSVVANSAIKKPQYA